MIDNPILKKLQLKDESKPILIINSPEEFNLIIPEFNVEVHNNAAENKYKFIQIFGTNIESLKEFAQKYLSLLEEDGLFWLCFPKKSSKKYKGCNCGRDEIAFMLGEEGLEPVRLVAIDEDWSALRFKTPDKIKTMKRSKAVTEEGKKRLENK